MIFFSLKKKREQMKALMLRMLFPDLSSAECSVVQEWDELLILLI